MAASTVSRPPVRISKVAGRYLLFDIDDVMHLRKNHNICSVFVGTIPQNPQQNIFMGLPIELMPEEAQVLVDKNVAYIVDDAAFHPARLAILDDDARRRYLQSVKAEGRMAQMAAAESKLSAKPKVITTTTKKEKVKPKKSENEASLEADDEETSTSLFSPPSPPPSSGVPSHSQLLQAEDHPAFAITPTTSSLILPPSPPHAPPEGPFPFPFSASVTVPPSYPLYAHLQDRGYYMMPGLRFGCDYNVYPGDPLRFHSHFQAASYGWEEEIAVLDLVAGGRLGTNVKKGYLIGGAVVGDGTDKNRKKKEGIDENPNAPRARAFCIEWAAM
ncbi:SEN34 subunit of tRNA-splicing endonuclease [Daldinia vernicosa]|uniref:SEN34 subunit of tRNA-splicing endonuclease n=1 Tax=Daldinia vernicosa TaxID=114800 RepID=UPI00200841CB|nr:SEN34 subunit of tRNA-splicing endonuclease [Daldinia vernicosa]KAI0846749.1 SEN34 subunit of tRNA-splicing endonuclease [Daldinia vernicosa]